MADHDAQFNPLHPDVLRDPYSAYRSLREEDAVLWHEQLRSWILTRYADCATVLTDSDTFAADFRRIGIPTPRPLLSLQTLDPPEQTSLRQFALSAVHAQDLRELEEDATTRAREELRNLASRDAFDFVQDFAEPFALRTISKLLGAEPPPKDETWDQQNEELDRSMDSGLDPDTEEAGLRARERFSALVDTWLAARPTEGILGYVSRNQGRAGVSHQVLLNSVRAFWHAGFEVPSRFMCNSVLTILQDRRAADALRHAESLDLGVEELARYVGPVHALSRACTRMVGLGAHVIEAGDVVVAMIAAANRDPEQFDRPDELVIDRYPNPHLGFGRGAHACLGFMIGKMEVRVVLSEILRSYPGIKLTGEPLPRATATLRGLKSLPVRLGAPVSLVPA